MRRCIDLAQRARERGDAPVGAVVTREDRLVAEGIETVTSGRDVAGHAELNAIRAACSALGTLDLSGCVLYTTTEPCFLCSYAIREARIGRVVFGAAVEGVGGVTSRHPILSDPDIVGWPPPPAIIGNFLVD